MLKIYTYSKCSTCRNATQFLKDRKVSFQEVPIRETPPSIEELKMMLADYSGNIRRLFNTSGLDYKAQGLSEKLPQMSLEQALELLSKNGNLVKRPFLISEKVRKVGFKKEEWDSIK